MERIWAGLVHFVSLDGERGVGVLKREDEISYDENVWDEGKIWGAAYLSKGKEVEMWEIVE